MKKKLQRRTQDFNVKNPLQQRKVKTTGASQQNFTILKVFTNAVGYLMMRLNLASSLQGIYIGDGNDSYRRGLAQASGDGPRSARHKLAFTL
jgi:hypothetical protein